MVAEVIKLKNRIRKHRQTTEPVLALLSPGYWLLNCLFLLDGLWHIWALLTDHTGVAFVSKFLLAFTLGLNLKLQLREKLPTAILTSILFCLVGDVLLQPLDLNYADMGGNRPAHFLLGVLCFSIAYGHLARYFLSLNPDWLADLKAQPWTMIINVLVTLVVLSWMSMHNAAPPYLLAGLWIYSPIVVAVATLAFYMRSAVEFWPYLALVIGANVIVFSDTIIGVTTFAHIVMPLLANPVWILGTYIAGIFLVFNAIIFIEKAASTQ